VIVAPVIPFLNDKDLESVVEAAARAGALSAGYTLARLPHEVKILFKDWLKRYYPLKFDHVMARIRDMRGGRENDPNFGSRMNGEGEFAALISRRFTLPAAASASRRTARRHWIPTGSGSRQVGNKVCSRDGLFRR